MEPTNNPITVETTVNAPVEKVWEIFTNPAHVTHWNNASPDWHTPRAENDLREGGTFTYRMEARDGSMGFDFGGVYSSVVPHQSICYTIGDGRRVAVYFAGEGNSIRLTETFEAETVHSADLQRSGWQAILDNLKAYTENGN
ncbi:MAG: SRPBCC family protein [Chitinophagaceae bacterium]|nr:SRPBCC family protein [Chitinophagaceae bacterium]